MFGSQILRDDQDIRKLACVCATVSLFLVPDFSCCLEYKTSGITLLPRGTYQG